MALYKEKRQEDGVTTKYHRILFLQNTVNVCNAIAVFSYVDEEARQSEKEGAAPYIKSITYQKPYDEDMSIQAAYSYLKTLPEFEGAEDV
jgi:hypothetical protein